VDFAVDARVLFSFYDLSDVFGDTSLAADSPSRFLAAAAAIAVTDPILRSFLLPVNIIFDFYPDGFGLFCSSSG